MAAIFSKYDPNDYKPLLARGSRLSCDYCLLRVVVIQKSGELPLGWELRREKFAESGELYAISGVCPNCSADEQARYATAAADLALERFEAMKQAYIDWQYLVVVGGGIARKSDGEAWLMARYGIDDYRARQITNQVTDGPTYFTISREGVEWVANRPAPMAEQYPEIVFRVYERL